jgi:DNA polymerase
VRPQVTADFETRSRADLTDVGSWRYSRDSSTSVLCLYYSIDGAIYRWLPGDAPPYRLFRAIEAGAEFEAHNVFFEWCIWEHVCAPRYGWPHLRRHNLFCTAARAAVACLPRKLELALPLAGCKLRKLDSAAVKKLSRPRKPTKHDAREWIEDPTLYRELYRYCRGDVRGELELSSRIPQLTASEEAIFRADFNINARGIRIDVGLVHAALRLARHVQNDIGAELFDVTRGAVMAATERDRVMRWLARAGLELPNLTDETVQETLFRRDLTPAQRRVLELRQEGARSSNTKYAAFEAIRDGEYVHGLYRYYGANAHGRWAGQILNPQNFPRGTAKYGELKGAALMAKLVHAIKRHAATGDIDALAAPFELERYEVFGDPTSKKIRVPCSPAEVLSTALRGAFIARDGTAFGVGDYASIEVHALFWLAEEEYGLNLLRALKDVYRDMGSVIFSKPPEELDAGFERQLGKTTVLGCGYGMGWERFIAQCKAQYGMVISQALGKASVYGYRNRYEAVPDFWELLEKAARRCIKKGARKEAGPISFRKEDGHLFMRLPSGREIMMRHARISKSTGEIHFQNGKGFTEKTYGGKLCEYGTSGTARDLLADAIVKAEFECPDIQVVMHSHDELVAEGVPGRVGKIVQQIMLDSPSWAKGLPVRVEAHEADRYHK